MDRYPSIVLGVVCGTQAPTLGEENFQLSLEETL